MRTTTMRKTRTMRGKTQMLAEYKGVRYSTRIDQATNPHCRVLLSTTAERLIDECQRPYKGTMKGESFSGLGQVWTIVRAKGHASVKYFCPFKGREVYWTATAYILKSTQTGIEVLSMVFNLDIAPEIAPDGQRDYAKAGSSVAILQERLETILADSFPQDFRGI